MKLLMHTCCAPCSVYCIDTLRAEGIEPTLYWYNPNIHPFIEYKTRRDCLKDYASMVDVKLIVNEDYGLDEFCRNVINDIPGRCVNYCYRKRIGETVRFAVENGYDAFTTTLLVSPYQKHEGETVHPSHWKYGISCHSTSLRVLVLCLRLSKLPPQISSCRDLN